MSHKHIYDENGKQLCCTLEEKINLIADLQLNNEHEEDGCCATTKPVFERTKKEAQTIENANNHSSGNSITLRIFFPAIISFLLLSIAIVLDNFFSQPWFLGWLRVAWYILANAPVGLPVLKEAAKNIFQGKVFSEFF
ncbi:MAG: heavy metal translocating P-type ATPase, partial [Bacteroidales bacterium]|nr:heavy metal translocating P-type ATPase [Bacteroidales bacterium]